MTGTINHMAAQSRSHELLQQAADARQARRPASPKRKRSWSFRAQLKPAARAALEPRV
jgi:hypothetical protein